MSLKKDLAKEIRILQEEILALESKRSRSQAALIEALISRKDPDEKEMQYFRSYSAEIDIKRERLVALTKQLEEIV